jgi:hypothetical protein
MNNFNVPGIPGWLGVSAIAGVLLGLVTSFWAKIKFLIWRGISHFIVQIEIRDEITSNAVLAYLLKNYYRTKVYDRTYGASYEYTRADGKYGIVPYEYLGSKTLIFWKNRLPILFCVAAPTSQPQQNTQQNSWWQQPQQQNNQVKTLTFVRGTFDYENIINEACAMRNQMSWNTAKDSKQRRFFIRKIPNPNAQQQGALAYSAGTSIAWYQEGHYRLLKHQPWELGKAQIGNRKALDYLIFPDRIKRLIREIQIWRNNREWYMERGLPWKRGWILYGPPGTGKTGLVRAFAEDEDMPLFVFSLGELMNGELQRSWEEMQAHVPCIALFEDVDSVFHGRHNIAGNNLGLGKILGAMSVAPPTNGAAPAIPGTNQQEAAPKLGMLSFDCLLNCIDGVQKSDGIFTIITTNDITKIDPALGQPRTLPDGAMEFISSRPGRIDKAIELTYMEYDDKIIMAKRILSEYPEGLEQMFAFLAKYVDLKETPAQFQERCAQLALSYFWTEQADKEDLIGCSEIVAEIHKKVLSVNGLPKIEKFIDTTTIPATHDRWNPPDQDEDMSAAQDLRQAVEK